VGGDVAIWIPIFTQGGVIAVLSVWIYLEVSDRKERQKKFDALNERAIQAIADVTAAIRSGTDVQQATREVVASLREMMMLGSRDRHDH